MHLVEKHKIKYSNARYKILDKFSHLANNLYNQGLYQIKTAYETDNTYLSYNDLDVICKNFPENFDNYHRLPAASSQQILRQLSRDFKSFYRAVQSYKKDPSRFNGAPKPPAYRKSGSRAPFYLTNQQCKIVNGKLTFPKIFNGLTITVKRKDMHLKHVRVLPGLFHFVIELVYDVPDVELKQDGITAGIDLGLNTLAAVVFDDFSQPILLNGRPLKSYNTYWNAHIDNYKAILAKTQNAYTSNRLKRLYDKRNNIISDYMHKAAKSLVTLLIERGVNRVIIGHNTNQKQGSKIKHFVQLPTFKFMSLLIYKCQLNGIDVIQVKESYTSGTSFLDNEAPIETNYNKSRRIKRGLFKSHSGQLINSDVNGAYQIIKKLKVYENLRFDGATSIFNPLTITL